MKFFMFVSFVLRVFFYYRVDPVKVSLFLVMAVLFLMPGLSGRSFVWFSYYVRLVFLGGVFAILVYFCSLRKFVCVKKPFWLLFFFVRLGVSKVFWSVLEWGGYVGISEIYYSGYLGVMVFVVLGLVLFLNFVSYFLSLGVAIRRV